MTAWYTSSVESSNKDPPVINIASFIWYNLLVSECGCKAEVTKLLPLDSYFVYKTVKLSHLKKLEIILNINNLIFQVVVTWGVMIEPGGNIWLQGW